LLGKTKTERDHKVIQTYNHINCFVLFVGKRSAGIGSSAEAGGNVFFQPKAKQTPKPTPEPTTAAPTQAPTTPEPTTTTPMPTTTKPKPNKYALSVGSSATGNKDPNFIGKYLLLSI